MRAALLLLLALPCVCSVEGTERRPMLKVVTVSLPRKLTIVTSGNAPELADRERLPTPAVTARPGEASPTRAPWIVANGWRFMRAPDGKYAYDLPQGKAALAAAEALAYGADAVLKIDPADAAAAHAMTTFVDGLPAVDLPPVADIAVVDDGSPIAGEVMNLLARRNLLFKPVKAPASDVRLNIAIGSAEYPAAEAADPSGFALKVRRQLGDDQRTLRIFGSEVVICRVIGDARRMRVHLLNYGGRDIDGLRIRLRGEWRDAGVYLAGSGRVSAGDLAVAEGGTELSIPRLAVYAVVDLVH